MLVLPLCSLLYLLADSRCRFLPLVPVSFSCSSTATKKLGSIHAGMLALSSSASPLNVHLAVFQAAPNRQIFIKNQIDPCFKSTLAPTALYSPPSHALLHECENWMLRDPALLLCLASTFSLSLSPHWIHAPWGQRNGGGSLRNGATRWGRQGRQTRWGRRGRKNRPGSRCLFLLVAL